MTFLEILTIASMKEKQLVGDCHQKKVQEGMKIRQLKGIMQVGIFRGLFTTLLLHKRCKSEKLSKVQMLTKLISVVILKL